MIYAFQLNNTQPTLNENLLTTHPPNKANMNSTKKKHFCEVCGKEITQQEYEDYEGMCWEYWDDQLTEESDTMFGDLI